MNINKQIVASLLVLATIADRVGGGVCLPMTKIWLITLLLLSCEAPRQLLSRHGNIIGINEIVPVAVAKEAGQVDAAVLRRSLNAAVLLVIATKNEYKHCFGSLLPAAKGEQQPRVVTNRHCFASARARLPATACAHTSAYFNFSQPETPLLGRRCARGSMRAHAGADLAIFKLQRKLPPSQQPLALWRGTIPPQREAFLLHYPHVIHNLAAPARSVQQLPGTTHYFPITAVSADGCVVQGRPKKGLWRLVPFGMTHSCDMTRGSSGAALLDFTTGKLLGVSWGGLKLQIGNITQKINFAISADFLRKFIDNEPLHDDEILKKTLSEL